MHGERITFVKVSPKSAANEGDIVNGLAIVFHEIDIRKAGTFITQYLNAFDGPFTMIEFMVSCNVDHPWELSTTSVKEIPEAIRLIDSATLFDLQVMWVARGMPVQVLGDHNVAGEDETVSALSILEDNVPEL
jgi:hypothetical protein